jgi:hypothetical protein
VSLGANASVCVCADEYNDWMLAMCVAYRVVDVLFSNGTGAHHGKAGLNVHREGVRRTYNMEQVACEKAVVVVQ